MQDTNNLKVLGLSRNIKGIQFLLAHLLVIVCLYIGYFTPIMPYMDAILYMMVVFCMGAIVEFFYWEAIPSLETVTSYNVKNVIKYRHLILTPVLSGSILFVIKPTVMDADMSYVIMSVVIFGLFSFISLLFSVTVDEDSEHN